MTAARNFPMNTNTKHANAGFSLVELMVALVAGLIVSSAVVAFMMSSFKSNAEYVQSTRLTQELRNSLDLVTRDVRRAGYNEKAMASLGTGSASPFSPMLVDTANKCIIYAYDRANGTCAGANGNGCVDLDTGEVRAIRRKVVTFNNVSVGVLEFAESASGTRPTCTGASATYTTFPPTCNTTSHWCALSDPSVINITDFALTDSSQDAGTQIRLRDVGITISGQLANSTSFTRSVNSSVRIRTDCFKPTSGYNCNVSP
jgi:prepilin-type N-terminal cleavage/methylation domain-containing protein